MHRYLLAAEADRIQHLIFQSSRLREVSGGSQLLTQVCRGVHTLFETALKDSFHRDDVLISDGGNFRIIFNSKKDAVDMGRLLADFYYQATGSTISVAAPVIYDESKFKDSMDAANKELRKVKKSAGTPIMSDHFPQVAICASCGTKPAKYYTSLYDGENEKYLCLYCERKAGDNENEFLDSFKKSIKSEKYDVNGLIFPRIPEEVGELDNKNYVAYLIADCNDMGVWFSKCTNRQQLTCFSEQMTQVLRNSLARPCVNLLEEHMLKKKEKMLPVLPLIMGGDDLFALLPARWSVHFAALFCQEYEKEMLNLVKELGLHSGVEKPTVSAAVVICKAKYPYTLAYKYGEQLLHESKILAKQLSFNNIHVSTMNFGVILGNNVNQYEALGKVTFSPYTLNNIEEQCSSCSGPGIQSLILQRYALRDLPSVWRSQLENLYDRHPAGKVDLNKWQKDMANLLNRFKVLDKQKYEKLVDSLQIMGKSEPLDHKHGYCDWKGSIFGHAFPDFLGAWDYLFDIGKSDREYDWEELR